MMDEDCHSDSHQPSSSVMESPLMQLANASIMRGSLSPKRDIKNAEVESKSNPFSSASLNPASSKANMYPNIPPSSNSDVDKTAQMQVPLESSVSNPSSDKLSKSSFAFAGSPKAISENVKVPHLSKRENVFSQVTETNVDILKPESHCHEECTKYSSPYDTHIFTKSSVSRVLTSNPSEAICTTPVAAGNTISKMRVDPKSFVSCPTSSQFPTQLRLNISPSQIKTTNLQGGNSSLKTVSAVKMIPCENVSCTPSESTFKTNRTAVQKCIKSISLIQCDTKASTNHNTLQVCSVTQEIQNDANSRPQTKYLSNTKVTSIPNTCSLPTKTLSVLPAASMTAPMMLQSSALPQLHTVTQSSENPCLLNKHVKKSQNISENLTTKEPITYRTSVNASTASQASSVTRTSFSRILVPAKSTDYISSHTSAVKPSTNREELNSSSTSHSSTNLVSQTSVNPISKQLTNVGEMNDALYSSSRKVIQAKVNVEIPSKLFSRVTSAKEMNTTLSKLSFTKHSNTDLVSRDSTVLYTPTISAIAPTTKLSPSRLISTISTSITCTTPLSISTTVDKLCTLPVSSHAPVISPQIVTDSKTFAMLTPPLLSSSVLSNTSYSSSLTTAATTYCSISCASSSILHTPSIATTYTSAVAACIPSTTVKSPKKLILLRESIANKCASNSKHVAKSTRCQGGNLPINATKDYTGMAHFIDKQSSNIQSILIQKQPSSTITVQSSLDKLQAPSFSDACSHVSTIAVSSTTAKTEACPSVAKTKPCPSVAKTEACPSVAKTEPCPSVAKTDPCPSVAKTEACPSVAKTDPCLSVAKTEACLSVAKTEPCPSVAKTDPCLSVAKTEACPSVAKTEPCPSIAKTEPCPSIAKTEPCPSIAKTDPCPSVAKTDPCPSVAKTDPCPSVAKTDPCLSVAKTDPCPSVAKTDPCLSVAKTEACPSIAKTEPCPSVAKTEPCLPNVKTDSCPSISKTDPCPLVSKTDACPPVSKTEPCPSVAKIELCPPTAETSMITGSEAGSATAGIKPQSATTKSEMLSSNFSVSKTSDEQTVKCKFPIEKSKNSSSKTETKKSSTIKKNDSSLNATSHCLTKVSSSDRNKQSSTISVATLEPVNDDTKKNLIKSKNISKVSSSVSPVSELGPSPTKKSKLLKKDSKSDTVCKKRAPSNSTSARSKKEDKKTVSSDSTAPKSPSPLKNNPIMSSDKKDESLHTSLKPETAATTKEGNTLNKTEESNISTRPRRTIKARHLFSSSPYSTGEVKSETAGESSSKQRKRVNPPSTSEDKKGKSTPATKKSHTSKTADEEIDSPSKKPMHRCILPAIKTDSKKCVLIKESSPNVTQVPSDNPIPTGCTYLLTPVSLTNTESSCVKTMKTPTMASNAGVTSTSPTYSNSKRNVTTKCSSTKEQQSTKINKTSINYSVSSSGTSASQKTKKISPVNATSKESLKDANESDLLQNSIKMSSSNCVTSFDNLSQQIAEAETFIKKEPLEITEVSENNALAISQNSSAECAPMRETPAINNFLNTDCSNTQVPIVQDFISPSSGNNVSQTRPLAPVQLSSPYAIFLPVSLASGATTTSTTPSSAAPLYSIQLNVPNVVRMGKPLVPNDGGVTKKCAIIPTIASKTDNSSVKSSLISRNNLLATYSPAPVPESLMNKITVDYHACEQCGDTFLFKSSLDSHKSRKCMQLTYNCDNCTIKLIFYNKCSVLEHIRSHYPNRPVTIKLEKIELAPLPESITDVLEMDVECKEESSPINSEEAAATNFDCTECHARFQSARALADHFGHSQLVCSFTFYCALCQTYLPRRCSHLAHQRIHHEKPPYVCPECGQLIPNILSFREHLKYKCMHFSRIASITCPKCTSKFSYTPELKDHIINVHGETFIKCSICPMAFKAAPSYQTHHQNTHASEAKQNKEIYKCPLCDTVFHTTQQLLNHVEIHIVELKKGINYSFRCSMCTGIFAKRSQLVSHLITSHHRCEFCDCICKTAHNLQTHQKAIHKIEVKKLDATNGSTVKNESASVKTKKKKGKDVTHCTFCHIFFATQAQLQVHTAKVHQKKTNDSPPEAGTDESASSAPVTKNKFPQKVCQYCKAPYKSWSRLMQHILGHRKSGVYICFICTSASFVDEDEFLKHEELCGGEKIPHDKPSSVYECDECHQLFNQESWLSAHQKNIHPKKDALTCDACGLHYQTNSSLEKHMQTVHEGKTVFCCYYCKELNVDRSFRCQNQLEKHLLAKHSASLNEMKIEQSDDEEEEDEISPTSEKANCKNSCPTRKSVDVVPAKKAKTSPVNEETYICAKCNFTSKKFKIFQLHIQEHDAADDAIQCCICQLRFAAADSLRMHLFAVHKIKSNDAIQNIKVNKSPVPKETENDSPCPVSKSPALNTSVENSESTNAVTVKSAGQEVKLAKPTSDTNCETNSVTCECNVCLKKFETEHQLKAHMRTHGMAFIRSKYLTTSDVSSS